MVLAASALFGQTNALLPARDAIALYKRTLQLMESTSAVIPGLVRAGAPIVEDARHALRALETIAPDHSARTYDLLLSLQAYLALADAVPKPYPFPEEGRKQFTELRDSVTRVESHYRALLDQREALLRTPDRDNLRRYSEANARLDKPSSEQSRVVFLGDSITDGWRINEYFPNRDFVNRGIGGQMTGQMLGRMKADVIDVKPAAVLILAGTNDIARGLPLGAIQNNLSMIADLADAHKIKVLMASVLPISDYNKDKDPRNERSPQRPPATIRELNTWIEHFCKQRSFVYVDYFSKLVDKAGMLPADLADDGLHPNAAGYRVMAPVALESIEKTLSPVKAQPKKRRGLF